MSTENHVPKSVVSVSEMARRCSLSRQRFHQLRKQGFFPQPDYSSDTGRPFYDEEKQAICLDVRKRNYGVNGRAILFYAGRTSTTRPSNRPLKSAPPKRKKSPHHEMLESLKALGLLTITTDQVEAAIKAVFPDGTDGRDDGEVIRSVFLYLKNSTNA